MKALLPSFSAIAILLFAAPVLHAQITWESIGTYTGTDADIATNGSYVAAVTYNNDGLSENVVDAGTLFDWNSDSHISGGGAGGGDGSGVNAATATPYQEALNGCSYVNVIYNAPPADPGPGVSQVTTFHLTGLVQGDVYQVQVWNVVGYAGPNNANGRETELSGVTPTYLVGSDFAIGDFTATSSLSQSFTMQGLPGGSYGEVDAIALRDLGAAPEPSTYAMLFAGLGALVVVSRLRRTA